MPIFMDAGKQAALNDLLELLVITPDSSSLLSFMIEVGKISSSEVFHGVSPS